MSYQEQIIQHTYCDTCFSDFICENCSYYSFPCLNCEIYGHICSLNCESLPIYPGPKYPPGLPIPPNYVDETIKKVLPKEKTYKQVLNEEKNKGECCGCYEENKIVDWIYNDKEHIYELKNACLNCLECGILCNEDNINE